MNDRQQLSDLQRRLLPMLNWFHDFCVNNGLRYYMLGGTMLGAARHEGFIPWDDDVDVGMPRKDYIKFLQLTKGKVFGDYVVEGIDTEKSDFFYGYTKVYDTQTTLIENTGMKIKRGIYLDVFPLDGLCNRENEISSQFRPIYLRYSFLIARTCAVRKERKRYKNAAVYIARLIPDRIINNKRLMISIDRMCQKHDFDECEIAVNFYGNWGIREAIHRCVFGEPKLYSFENLKIYGVSDYDRYLTCLYGDWRRLPPPEKQASHHDYLFLDLHTPFQVSL